MKTLRLAVAVTFFAASSMVFAGPDDAKPNCVTRACNWVKGLTPVESFKNLSNAKKAGVLVAAGAVVAGTAAAVYYFTQQEVQAEEEAAE